MASNYLLRPVREVSTILQHLSDLIHTVIGISPVAGLHRTARRQESRLVSDACRRPGRLLHNKFARRYSVCTSQTKGQLDYTFYPRPTCGERHAALPGRDISLKQKRSLDRQRQTISDALLPYPALSTTTPACHCPVHHRPATGRKQIYILLLLLQ